MKLWKRVTQNTHEFIPWLPTRVDGSGAPGIGLRDARCMHDTCKADRMLARMPQWEQGKAFKSKGP